MTYIISLIVFLAVLTVVTTLLAIIFRRVVETNKVHIVQSRKTTASYGTGNDNGNVYYAWPSWVPWFGVKVIELPVSNFNLSLANYAAYDKDRVPFLVDVTAFFRIKDTNIAAQRVASIDELKEQLKQIAQGAVRKILASDVIDKIMVERSKFGNMFTEEVGEQLAAWGVETVKSMELMDIRDENGSEVVHNIMAKKKSHIEMESRIEVAKNHQTAKIAEIEAQQAQDVRAQEAEQAVGQRTADKDKAVGIANQQASQEIQAQAAITKEREMAVVRVGQVQQAEITRDKAVVEAEQNKKTTVIIAEGALEATKRASEGIEIKGKAEGAAALAIQMAPVNAQISLAKEIGSNPGYQNYLAMIEGIKAYLAVGSEQAKALQGADIKVIANTGKPTEGVNNVMDLFTSKGGTNLSAMVEAFAQTPLGQATLAKFGIKISSETAPVKTAEAPATPAAPKGDAK